MTQGNSSFNVRSCWAVDLIPQAADLYQAMGQVVTGHKGKKKTHKPTFFHFYSCSDPEGSFILGKLQDSPHHIQLILKMSSCSVTCQKDICYFLKAAAPKPANLTKTKRVWKVSFTEQIQWGNRRREQFLYFSLHSELFGAFAIL